MKVQNEGLMKGQDLRTTINNKACITTCIFVLDPFKQNIFIVISKATNGRNAKFSG